MILLLWIRVPKVRSKTRHLVPFGGLSQYPSGYTQCRSLGVALGASSHYLDEMMMTDEKLFQMLRFAKRSNVFQTNSMKTCGLRFMKVWKITCDMVVQIDCLEFMVSCLSSLCCHCSMMIKDGAKETLAHKTIHL